MRNSIYEIDVTRKLPPALKNNEEMLGIATVVGSELQENCRLAKLCLIYARIDELDESILDILAYDLHVDWYDYSYPIEAKRALIKDSVKVHKRLGTKYAVETALRNIYPNSRIEEWFDYGGRPYTFKVVTSDRITSEQVISDIRNAINPVKNVRSHLTEFKIERDNIMNETFAGIVHTRKITTIQEV